MCYLPLSETFIFEQIKRINQFEVMIVCAKKMNLDQFPFENIKSLSDLNMISYLLNGALLKFAKYCPYFAKIIKENDVSLIYAPFGWNGLHALSYKKKFGIPLIVSFYGHDVAIFKQQKKSRMKHLYLQKLFKKGNMFLVLSEDMKKDLINLGCPAEKIKIHRLGIDLSKFRFCERKIISNEPTKILTIARFVEKKGIPYLIHAFSLSKRKYPNIKLKIIGDGPMREKIVKLIHDLNLSTSIEVSNYVPYSKLPDEYYNHHLFVLHSITASDGDKDEISTVTKEAMATGMPVITTYHAGIPETFKDGECGFLVRERDVKDLSNKLNYLIEHRELWSKFASAGRRLVEREFDVEKQVKKLEDNFQTVLI